MCALCAVLGRANHWADAAGRAEFSWLGNKITRRSERSRRVALCKLLLGHYGLDLDDVGGTSYVVSNHAGRAEEAFRLPEIWTVAARLAGRPCDPLDPELIKVLGGTAD